MNSTLIKFMVLLAFGALVGCETADSGSGSGNSNVYYGAGFNDPWYYGGDYDDDVDIIAVPPRDRGEIGAHPEPYSRSSAPEARPMSQPSIPSMPRGGGGGGGRRR